MAEELVSTVGILATSKASCNVVKADENGLVILSEFPQITNGITLGGGYIPGQGIVIGSGNGLVEGYENTQIIIGNEACVKKCTEGGMHSYYNDNNIVIGSNASAMSGDAVAIGDNAFATTRATALGYCANASECGSTALGSQAKASGDSSTALGYNASASEFASTALGHSARASGCFSMALGYDASTSGFGALAMGYNAEAAENEIMLRSQNSTNTACNVLKVSSTGVLTLNNTEIKPTCVVTDLQTILASATTVDTTDNAFTLKQVADSLNTLITLLKGTATTTTE